VSVARNEFACIIDVDDVETAIAMGMPIPQDTFIVNSPSGASTSTCGTRRNQWS